MDIHGYPWISMDIHGYPWISLNIHGYPWISMDIHGYQDARRGQKGPFCGFLEIQISIELLRWIWNQLKVRMVRRREISRLAAGDATVRGTPWKHPGEDSRRGKGEQNDTTRLVTPKGSAVFHGVFSPRSTPVAWTNPGCAHHSVATVSHRTKEKQTIPQLTLCVCVCSV